MIWDKVAVLLRFIRPSFAPTLKRPYRPQQVLIANEQPHDVGGLLRLPFPGAVRQPAGDGLVEEEVGGHDGGHGPQVHPVPLLPGDHFAEELEQSLREDTQRHKCWGGDSTVPTGSVRPEGQGGVLKPSAPLEAGRRLIARKRPRRQRSTSTRGGRQLPPPELK